jgi:hypothetical protein
MLLGNRSVSQFRQDWRRAPALLEKKKRDGPQKGGQQQQQQQQPALIFLDIIEPVFDEDCGSWQGSSLSLRLRG